MERSCKQCGKCCYMTPALTDNDIHRIKRIGLKEKDFIENLEKKYIKANNGKCMFLIERKDKTACAIYTARPEICRQYPSELKEDGSCQPVEISFDKFK